MEERALYLKSLINICNSSLKALFLYSRQVKLSQVKFSLGELSHLQTWLVKLLSQGKSSRVDPIQV
jgi:hypothetical protein